MQLSGCQQVFNQEDEEGIHQWFVHGSFIGLLVNLVEVDATRRIPQTARIDGHKGSHEFGGAHGSQIVAGHVSSQLVFAFVGEMKRVGIIEVKTSFSQLGRGRLIVTSGHGQKDERGWRKKCSHRYRRGLGPQSSTWRDKGKMSMPQIRRRLSDISDDETDEGSGERLRQ